MFEFTKQKTITTSHGFIQTPVFMPVGTNATVKALSPEDLKGLGAQIILANNYHLFLQPGSEKLKTMGGIHQFMAWDRPILTDSGGFQIMSLGKEEVSMAKIDEDGVTFRSHLDGGTLHKFTPEIATQSQINIGADIIMAFDCPVPTGADRKTAEICVRRTHEWLKRCIEVVNITPPPPLKLRGGAGEGDISNKPALFGIIQGGIFPDLLQASAEFVIAQDLPGIAIGGAVIGSDPHQTSESISAIRHLLPANKPLYAMGVGVRPSDAISVIKAGADMFDCVAPTRLARCGQLYHPEPKSEYIDISKSLFALDKSVINSDCDCYTCKSGFTKGYLHHLFKSRELLYYRLASIHNLRTMIRTVENYSHV